MQHTSKPNEKAETTKTKEQAEMEMARAQDQDPRGRDDSIVDSVEQGFEGPLNGMPGAAAAFRGVSSRGQYVSLRISQSCAWPPVFDGSVANGEQTQQEVLICRGRISAVFGQKGGFVAAELGVPIKVGCLGASVEALTKAFGLDG